MIVTIDTETQGLNPKDGFLMGCIHQENGKTTTHKNKEELCDRLLAIAHAERKRGKKLTVYAHNLQYDYIAIGAHKWEQNKEYSTNPLIVNTMYEGKDLIKWIDSFGLWRGSLASMGEMIGAPKGHTPEWLKKNDYDPNEEELAEAKQYMIQDCKVLMAFIKLLKNELREEGVTIKYLVTAPQLAYNYFLTRVRAKEVRGEAVWDEGLQRKRTAGLWLHDKEGGTMRGVKNADLVHEGYRGGRVQCFKPGNHWQLASADVNSLYPYVASIMRFPDLRTEHHVNKPDIEEFLETDIAKIGVSKVLILCPEQKIGYLPVRQMVVDENGSHEETFYPNHECSLYGTWTHGELIGAIKEGYNILYVSESVTWDDGPNPLAEFFGELGKKKNESTGGKRAFYKLMMNGLLGKFAQRRRKVLTRDVDVEEQIEWKKKGWRSIAQYGNIIRMEKKLGYDLKRNYCPIISCLVTANARDYMHGLYKQVGDGIVYTDTDSIVWDLVYSDTTVFKYGDRFGELRLEENNATGQFYGKKAYRLGSTIKLNRVPRAQVTREAFDNGVIHYKEILGIRQTTREEAGTQIIRERILTEQTTDAKLGHYTDSRTTLDDTAFETLKQWYTRTASSDSSTSSSGS